MENDKQKMIFDVLRITNMTSLCKKSKPHTECIFHPAPFRHYFHCLSELPRVLSEMSSWVQNLLKIVTLKNSMCREIQSLNYCACANEMMEGDLRL